VGVPVAVSFFDRDADPEQVAQPSRREHLTRAARGGDPTFLEQDDLFDLGDDLVDVMRDEDERRASSRDLADALHEIVARRQIQARRRLVEHQRTG
jgi:hypothetical protein